jgi:hypothetical protein
VFVRHPLPGKLALCAWPCDSSDVNCYSQTDRGRAGGRASVSVRQRSRRSARPGAVTRAKVRPGTPRGSGGLFMKVAFVSLLILAMSLAGFGVFGIADYLIGRPGWEAAKKDGLYQTSPQAPLPKAYKDYVDSLDRSRNVAFTVSLLSLFGGIALGAWSCRTYFKRLRSAGGLPVRVCNICGAKLRPGEQPRGVCDPCNARAG